MKAKEYLSQAYYLDQRINSKLEQVARLRELSTKATSRVTATRVSGTPDRSPLENAIVKLIDLENEVNRDVDRLVDLRRDIQALISTVNNPTYYYILERRYLFQDDWSTIANSLNYNVRWVLSLHGRAMAVIEKNRLLKCTKMHTKCT